MKIRVRKRNLKRRIGLDEDWTLRLKMKKKGRWWRDASGGGSGGGLEDRESGYGEKKRKKRRSHGRVEMGNK